MELLAEGVTGGIGGLLGRTAAFPFDTMKVKLATTKDGSSTLAIVRRVMAEEGILGFYRGLPFSAFEGMYQKFLYVMLYSAVKRFFRRLLGREPALAGTVLCGYFSDLLCVPFSMPFEAMVVQMQSAPANASKMEIVRKCLFSWKGIWTSIKTGKAYIVLSLKPGIEFAAFDCFKASLLQGQGDSCAAVDLPPLAGFLLGGVARAMATLVVYPYARGKAMSQAHMAPSAFAAVRQVLETEGALAMYRGLGMELSRGITQSAVMFAAMERVRAVVRRLLIPPSKVAPL